MCSGADMSHDPLAILDEQEAYQDKMDKRYPLCSICGEMPDACCCGPDHVPDGEEPHDSRLEEEQRIERLTHP